MDEGLGSREGRMEGLTQTTGTEVALQGAYPLVLLWTGDAGCI